MHKATKIISVILVILTLSLAILFFPFAEKTSIQLDHSVLLEYHRVGGIAGFNDKITIFKDGTVHFNNEKTKISSENLQQLTSLIEKKQFSLKRKSLIEKWTEPTCCDFMYTSFLINQNNKTVLIEQNKELEEVISQIKWEVNLPNIISP